MEEELGRRCEMLKVFFFSCLIFRLTLASERPSLLLFGEKDATAAEYCGLGAAAKATAVTFLFYLSFNIPNHKSCEHCDTCQV